MRFLPWKRKALAPAPATVDNGEWAWQNAAIYPEEKNFDWAHYQSIAHGGIMPAYQDEYNFIPTIRVLKSLYVREPWVNACINAIGRQFMGANLVLKMKTSDDDDEQVLSRHPLLDFLKSAGRENPAFFTSNNIIDMVATGNAYVWIDPLSNEKRRLPAERVDIKFAGGRVQSYQITNPNGEIGDTATALSLSPDEVLHFQMPNPYTPYVGLSPLIAINLPVLIDKYGREFIVGFFLRGGHVSGIIETDATNADQLTRFVKSIMQALGGRRNAHADKVLPKGATWKGAAKFNEIQLLEILKHNERAFRAATGITNTVLGIVEGLNRATAFAEMENFWRTTILPLQYIYCAAIKHSVLWKRFGLDDRYDIAFDNSNVEYINDWGRRLDEDAKLRTVATVNERRARLGYEPIERLGDLFESEMAGTSDSLFSMFSAQRLAAATQPAIADKTANPMVVEKANLEKLQEPTARYAAYLHREFARWEEITLANLKNLDRAREMIEARADTFAEETADILLPAMMKVYDYHIKRVVHGPRRKALSDEEREAKLEALKERGKRVLQGKALDSGRKRFRGYSQNNMQIIHAEIAKRLEEGENLNDVAKYVRDQFKEFYEGQAQLIVRQEFSSAMSEASYQFGVDLGTVATKMRKIWVSMNDDHTREEHKKLDNAVVEGPADQVADMPFQIDGVAYLRYPRDERGTAKQVIGCRCDIIWEVVEWKE